MKDDAQISLSEVAASVRESSQRWSQWVHELIAQAPSRRDSSAPSEGDSAAPKRRENRPRNNRRTQR